MSKRQFVKRITLSLPPASEGWGKVLCSVCSSVHTLKGGGVPWPGLDGGGGGGTPARCGWGVPLPGFDGGVYPGQVWMVGVGVP